MTGSFTGRAVAEMVQKYVGSHPVEVEVMNDHDTDLNAPHYCEAGDC